MPRRPYTPLQQRVLVGKVIARDGYHCNACRAALNNVQNDPLQHTLDHINHDKWDQKPENLRLLCRSCNGRDGANFKKANATIAKTEQKRGDVHMHTQTDHYRVEEAKSPEKRMSDQLFALFTEYLTVTLTNQGALVPSDAIDSGCFVAGIRRQTGKDYFAILTSSAGPFQVLGDGLLHERN
jgi:5-methylcytosine-specific restriction endonuclease McrA